MKKFYQIENAIPIYGIIEIKRPIKPAQEVIKGVSIENVQALV